MLRKILSVAALVIMAMAVFHATEPEMRSEQKKPVPAITVRLSDAELSKEKYDVRKRIELKEAVKVAAAKKAHRKVIASKSTYTQSYRGGWRTAKASWYGAECYGHHTADGTLYGANTWCVANKTLPLGTIIEIRYRGKTVQVPVKDRGPYVTGREFDLSAAVARALGFTGVQSIEWRIVR